MITAEKGGTLTDMQAVAEILQDTLNASMTKYITSIQGVINEEEIDETWQFVNDHLPLFLNDDDYAYLERRLAPDSLKSMVESQYKTMLTPAGMVAQQIYPQRPFWSHFFAVCANFKSSIQATILRLLMVSSQLTTNSISSSSSTPNTMATTASTMLLLSQG